MSRWDRWGRRDDPRVRAGGDITYRRRAASTRLMWHFHARMARGRDSTRFTSDWLSGLVPSNPSPSGDPLALLREAERRREVGL
jgi:hypothetical protein